MLADRNGRSDPNKRRWDLVDFPSLEPLVQVLEFGAGKYSPDNWRKGLPVREQTASLMRHVVAYMSGEDIDPESGLPHLGHIMCNTMFLSWHSRNRKDLDDRVVVLPTVPELESDKPIKFHVTPVVPEVLEQDVDDTILATTEEVVREVLKGGNESTTSTTGYKRHPGIHPGLEVGQALRELGVSPSALMAETSLSRAFIDQVLAGKSPISPAFALAVEKRVHYLSADYLVQAMGEYNLHAARKNSHG